jgi:hypothetical protein
VAADWEERAALVAAWGAELLCLRLVQAVFWGMDNLVHSIFVAPAILVFLGFS